MDFNMKCILIVDLTRIPIQTKKFIGKKRFVLRLRIYRKSITNDILVIYFLFSSLLLLCGDIHPNPGPLQEILTYEEFSTKMKTFDSNYKILNLNARSLSLSKLNEYERLVSDMGKNCILAITETWFEDLNDLKPWQPADYDIFSSNRNLEAARQTKGGGVMLMVPKSLHAKRRNDLCSLSDSHFESLWVEADFFANKNEKLLLNVSYNPKVTYANCFLEQLAADVSGAMSERKHLFIMGDYNINLFDISARQKMSHFTSALDLKMVNTTIPTRIENTTPSLIDYILTDIAVDTTPLVSESCLPTDHLLTTALLPYYKPSRAFCREIIDYSRYSKNEFRRQLSEVEWDYIYTFDAADDMLAIFLDLIGQTFESLVSKRIVYFRTKRQQTPAHSDWLTQNCLQKISMKNTLFRQYKMCPTEENKRQYIRARNEATKQCRNAKNKNLDTKFQAADSKQKWRMINSYRGKTNTATKIDFLRTPAGDCVKDPKGIANLLNGTYSKLGEYVGVNRPLNLRGRSYRSNKFGFNYITRAHVLRTIKELDISKSQGPSKLPTFIFKDGSDILAPHITFIFNTFIQENKFPTLFKEAIVTPIYKNKDPSAPENYRPIAITNPLSKVFERLLLGQINMYLHKKNILSDSQYGFRSGHSTQDALLYAIESFRKGLDEKLYVGVLFLDLAKAFNSLHHSILTEKLKHIGFDDSSVQLIQSFLVDRKQAVKYDNVLSDYIYLNRGVPQGTVLGPLLYLLYINDINQHISIGSSLIQFADDTCVFIFGKSPEECARKLEVEIELLTKYFEEQKLTLNFSKTEFMVLHPNRKNTSNQRLNIRNTVIDESDSCKYLGVTIDNRLTFENHICELLRKMAGGIKSILAVKHFTTSKTRLVLFKSLVMTHVTYSALILTSANKYQQRKLQRQMNWGLRVCFSQTVFDSATRLRNMCNILTVERLIFYTCALKFWSLVNGQNKAFSDDSFPNFLLRQNDRTKKFYLQEPGKTRALRSSFLSKTVCGWNTLPLELRLIQSLKLYKQVLRSCLIRQQTDIPDNLIVDGWSEFRITF
jgi:exonuclease III